MRFATKLLMSCIATFTLTLCFSFTCALALQNKTSDDSSDPRFSEHAHAILESRKVAIQKELAEQTADEWAGEYYSGDHLGTNIDFSIAPKSGFTYTSYGCLGIYDLNYGDVAFKNGAYKLQFTYPNEILRTEILGSDLVPVRWGDRHYLIESERLIEFANGVNSGFEAETQVFGRRFLLKVNEGKIKVTGFPEIPAQYQKYLLKSPIKARIVKTEKTEVENIDTTARLKTYTTRLLLNVGTADGVLNGIKFYTVSPKSIFESVVVTNAQEHSSEASVTEYSPPKGSKLTWQLSTRRAGNL